MDNVYTSMAVKRMRSWCVDLLESGPFWVRRYAMSVIESCDDFAVRLQEDPDLCPDPFDSLGNFWTKVVVLCLKLDRRAPRGWHSRLMKGDKAYREWFTAPAG